MFIPDDVMNIVSEFLGENYWRYRKELTYVSQAIGFLGSDYALSSYWSWKKWRDRHPYLDQTFLPKSKDLTYLEGNPYVFSVKPPAGLEYNQLKRMHSQLRKKVYFY